MSGQSLGFVWPFPTQFDDPLFRFLATETDLDCTVYYFGTKSDKVQIDAEMAGAVGWTFDDERGYRAVFCGGMNPSAFARRVVSAGHDLIISSGYNTAHALLTALLAKRKGIPVGLRVDNILPEVGGRSRYWRLKRMVYPWLFRLYATGHPVGKRAADYLEMFGFELQSLFIFPYAVDHGWFARESAKARRDRAGLRAYWGLPADADVVCGVVKFSEREDPVTLVGSVRLAQGKNEKLALLLVGDGPLRPAVEEAAGSELGKRIVLAGYQKYSMLPAVYAASDVFVHPAEGPWEVSVTEALACGVPVIASDLVGSAHEIVEPNGLGYCFRYRDRTDLAKRIEQVVEDSQMRDRVRQCGLKALEPWDYAATADRLAAALRYAASRAGHR